MHIPWPWQTRFPGLLVCTLLIRIYVLMPQVLRCGREGSYVTIDYCQTLRWKASRLGMRRSQRCGQWETYIYRRGLPFCRLSPPHPGEDLARTIVDGTSLFCGEEHHFPSRFIQGGCLCLFDGPKANSGGFQRGPPTVCWEARLAFTDLPSPAVSPPGANNSL